MKISRKSLTVTIASTLLCVPAIAQTRYCIGGDLDNMTAAQKNTCSAKLGAVRQLAAAYGAPQDWHFVVVCGEEGWKQYAGYSMREDGVLQNAAADTNLEQHETFLREDRLDGVGGLQRVVAHEMASIVLHTNDELAIQKQMNVWTGAQSVQQAF